MFICTGPCSWEYITRDLTHFAEHCNVNIGSSVAIIVRYLIGLYKGPFPHSKPYMFDIDTCGAEHRAGSDGS